MTNALYLLGWNFLIASLFATAVWLACRTEMLRRRPALCHGLWLLVLFKLVTPPLILVPMLPAIEVEERNGIVSLSNSVENFGSEMVAFSPSGDDANALQANPAQSAVEPPDASTANAKGSPSRIDRPRETGTFAWRETVIAWLGVSLLVSVAAWLATMRQFRQVRRLLRGNSLQSGRAVELLRDVLRRFDSRSAPNLLIVDASITPMLWAEPGKSAIVLPRQLADTLDDDQLRSIIAHELGHFVRRDHWASLFAFMVTTLFWWNPVAWFARRELAAAAEACCDALALERLPGSRKAYAKTLLAVVDFVSLTKPLRPALGIAFGESRSLRRRFEILANANVRSGVSRAGWLWLAVGSATLMLLPARAQENPAPSVSRPTAAGASVSADEPNASTIPVDSEPNESSQNRKYHVTGVVFEKETHRPIAAATVNILVDSEQDPGKRSLSGTSNDDGRYRIEVPMGNVRMWFPRLKPGYWLDAGDAIAPLVTSPAEPIVTHDIGAKTGVAWPVQVVVEGGLPDKAEVIVSVTEIEDDATRQSWLRGVGSLNKHPNVSTSNLSAHGTGAFTQCGDTGKLVVSLGGGALQGIVTELIVEPGFDVTKVKQIAAVAGTDKVSMTDEGGLKATIGKAEVTLQAGRPLLTFHLARRSPAQVQGFDGRVVDGAGNPVEGVRVGAAIGTSTSSGASEKAATTDKDGQFILNVEMPETVPDSKEKRHLMLIITKDGYAAFDSPRIELPQKASAVIDVGPFILQTGRSLPIRVVDENNRPLAGAVVEPQNAYALRRQAIRTDSQGRGVLRNLPAGAVRMYASHGSLVHQSTVVVDDKPTDGDETTLHLKELNRQPEQAKQIPDPPLVGAAAPEWATVGWTDGQTHTLSDYRGKVVVLDFWGIWCNACLNGLPAMKELEAKCAGRADVVFLGIH